MDNKARWLVSITDLANNKQELWRLYAWGVDNAIIHQGIDEMIEQLMLSKESVDEKLHHDAKQMESDNAAYPTKNDDEGEETGS